MTVSEKNKNAVEHKKQSIFVQTPVFFKLTDISPNDIISSIIMATSSK